MMEKKTIALIVILLLAGFLRFYKLGSYPAINADEAAIGYNVYSLIRTGHDEHGNSWPIHFQSFNDYKPGLYFYIVLPFVKLFGLNVWSVRIPGALLGVGSVFLLYKLIEILRFAQNDKGSSKLEIIASAMLAISPWHIHFSRGGWEVNAATFFILLGVLLYIKGQKNLSALMLSVLSFAFSLYTYHAARIIVPLLGLGMVVIYWNKVWGNLKNILLAGLVGLVVVSPLVKDFIKPEISSRAAGVGLFADTGPLARINEQRGEHGDFTGIVPKLLHNKAVNYSLAFLENWSEHFHGEFLFLSGDAIQRNKVPETGQMYLFDLIFIVIGLIGIVGEIRAKEKISKGWLVVFWWLVVAPVAAALTFQSPHALRAHNLVIPSVIISAYGMVKVVKWLDGFEKSVAKLGGFLILGVLVFWNFSRYLHMYWVHMAKEYPFSSQYGLKQLVGYVQEEGNQYEKIIITDRYDQPYILFLFYSKYPPEEFQNDHSLTGRDQFGFSTVRNFGKYEFRSINYDIDQPDNPRSLIIGTDEEIPDEANVVKEIYGSNGYKYFQVVAN